jgi:integrase
MAVARANLRRFRLYDLRHTFASRHAMNGTDLVTLKDLLGHSRLEMVLRYAHASEQNKFEAIRRMEKTAGLASRVG